VGTIKVVQASVPLRVTPPHPSERELLTHNYFSVRTLFCLRRPERPSEEERPVLEPLSVCLACRPAVNFSLEDYQLSSSIVGGTRNGSITAHTTPPPKKAFARASSVCRHLLYWQIT